MRSRLLLIFILFVAFALRLSMLSQQDIWWDEARNLDVAMRAISQIASAPELDIQPPLYYYLLHGWLGIERVGIGSNAALLAWLARFLSVWFGVALVALTAKLAQRIGDAFALFAAATLGALSPFWLAESQETRMYTVALALLAGGAYALLRSIQFSVFSVQTSAADSRLTSCVSESEQRELKPEYWLLTAFVLASAAAFLVHYNAIFVLVAWYAWWSVLALLQPGWSARWRVGKRILICGMASALLVLPILPVALRQIPDYANPNLVVPTVGDYITQNFTGHLAGYTWESATMFGYANLWLWGVVAVIGTGLALLGIKRRRDAGFVRDFSFLLVWFVAALILYYIAVLDRGAFNIRYSAFVTPALFALAGGALAGWQLKRLPLGALFLTLVAAGMLWFVRADLTDERFFREETARVADWLREETRPGDLILIDQKYPFAFYYDRYAIDADEVPEGNEAAPARYLFVDINTLANTLDQWAHEAQRVFWVQWFESDTDPRHAVPFLLNQNGEHAGEQWFQGWSVDWWQMQPPNGFVLGDALTPLSMRFALPNGGAAVETVEVEMPSSIAAGEALPVTLRWQRSPGGSVDRPLKARIALYDSADNRLAQADERLLNDRHLAPAEWSDGDAPMNVYMAQGDAPLAPGTYLARLLVYDADTMEALTVLDAAGDPVGIEATLGEVTVESQP